jgi:hypothetical protein
VTLLKKITRIVRTARPHRYGVGLFCYMLCLILLTDCLVWSSSATFAGISWKSLAIYSLFAQPLWTLAGTKGLIREQADLIQANRWLAIDTLPVAGSLVLLGNSIGTTFKSKMIWIWLGMMWAANLVLHAPWYFGLLAPVFVLIGAINLTLISIACCLLSPKGYSQIMSSIFANICFVISGAVVPLRIFGLSHFSDNFNPISSIVAVPTGMLSAALEGEISAYSLSSLLGRIASALCWTALLFAIARFAERSRRAALHS